MLCPCQSPLSPCSSRAPLPSGPPAPPSALSVSPRCVANPFRMRTSAESARNSFTMNTSTTKDLKPFRMNTYENGRGGPPVSEACPLIANPKSSTNPTHSTRPCRFNSNPLMRLRTTSVTYGGRGAAPSPPSLRFDPRGGRHLYSPGALSRLKSEASNSALVEDLCT